MQQALICNNQAVFETILDEQLESGWRVVPKTFSVQMEEYIPNPYTPANRDKQGHALRSVYFVVVEKETEAPEERMDNYACTD